MDVKVVFNWKSYLALGGVGVAVILALKLDADAAERVSMYAIGTLKELVNARNSIH